MKVFPLSQMLLHVTLVPLVIVPSPLQADDWPQWRGPERDAVSRETGLLRQWPSNGPASVWRASGLGAGYSSVVVAHGLVFVTGERRKEVFCTALDVTNGKPRWICKIGESSRHTLSAPTVDQDRIYALDGDGDLVCLKLSSGEMVWQKSFLEDLDGRMMSGRGYAESPLIDGDRLVCTPGGVETMMVALNKMTGEVLWRTSIPDIGPLGVDGHSFPSMVVTEVGGIRQYVQFVGRGVIGVAADDGRFLWGYNDLSKGIHIPTPVVRDNLVFVANGYNAGSALLRLEPDGEGGIDVHEVYFLRGNRFQNHHGGMVLVGDHIFGGHGSNNGLPTCLELETGRIIWKRRGPGVGSAAVLYADDHLYFRYQNGLVALIEANPESYRLKGTFQLPGTGGDSWAHPVVANGWLYLREQDHLWVYDVTDRGDVSLVRNSNQPASSSPVVQALQRLQISAESLANQHALYRHLSDHDNAPALLVHLSDEHLQNGAISAEVLAALQAVPGPFVLDVAGTEFSNSGLEQASQLSHLVGLNLELCLQISDGGLPSLKSVANLRLLVLTGTAITDAGLAHLADVERLVALGLEICEGVTDAGCSQLGTMTALRALILKKTGFGTMITKEGLQALHSLTGLEVLNLYGNSLSDEDLAHLRPLKSLQELDLSLLAFTDKGVRHLEPLQQLQTLDMLYSTGFGGPRLTDAALKSLQKLPRLESLNLVGANITDAGLLQLSQLKRLKRLELVGSAVTPTGAEQFQLVLPACKVRLAR